MATVGKNGRKRWTPAEIAEQVDVVVEMMGRAKTPFSIRQALKERWGLPDSTAQQRIAAARQILVRDHLEVPRADKAADIINIMNKVMDMSLENNRGNDAIGAARLIAEITKLNRD